MKPKCGSERGEGAASNDTWESVIATMVAILAALRSPGQGDQNRRVTSQNWHSGSGGGGSDYGGRADEKKCQKIP